MGTEKLRFVDVRDYRICVNTILNTFYTHNLLRHIAKNQPTHRMEKAVERYLEDLDKFFEETIKEHAIFILSYLTVTCGGEVRHLKKYGKKRGGIVGAIEKIGIYTGSTEQKVAKKLKGIIEFCEERSKCYESLTRSLQSYTREEIIKFMELLVTAFNEITWINNGMGGKKWGLIAQTALNYWSNKISDTEFLDTVFTLRHNGGVLFNKMNAFALETNEAVLSCQLEVQAYAKSIEELVIKLTKLSLGVEPGCIALLERGRTFGWWNNDLAALCDPKKAVRRAER